MQRKVDRTEQLERLRERYQGRGKEGKSRLLTEFCEQYGYERKYAIKLLGASPENERRCIKTLGGRCTTSFCPP